MSSPPSAYRVLDEDDPIVEDSEGWLISYVDVLTLLVTLFVLLLSITGANISTTDESEPQASTTPSTSAPLVLGIPSPISSPQQKPQPAQQPQAPRLSMQAIATAQEVVQPITEQPPVAEEQHGIMPAASGIRPMIDGVAVSESPRGLTFRIEDRLLFASAEADLTESGREVLKTLLPTLERLPGQISVEGHTDSQPISTERFPSNWELSGIRASAVLRYLQSQGIEASRLRAIGYADTEPLADNATAKGRAANRRVELVVQSQDDALLP
ncbi:OmpA/MotB family protein [Phytohalomonas tamaricis]|uniref:OmpA/MotB family protein n=1 Tax=Phytohalomonas tamaricis TaxID=2081032 RepID=UPI0021D41D60|nr:OmpA family protein [Phytohalomonas tamaricis]